ncbi:TY-Chap domain-containing protein [Actinomadura fibrosa]|uniref:TY-Chap N-terminal domain-containing protein n=1 Tax=Actinomadura fibrosa TaxID=111802 RepID=A0ABW2Y5G7_9ACTN|nr:hypothetical protein [Actinomadura fibrosa]
MSTVDWGSFADGLAEDLVTLAAGALVVISEPGEPGWRRYVQFSQQDDRLHAEVVANAFLDESSRTSAEGEQKISQAGWTAPKVAHDNWTSELAWPASHADYRVLTEKIVLALRDGYGITSPESWRYRAWNDRKGNRPFRLARLEDRGLGSEE